MYLISVYFDEKTNQTLQRYINQIAEKSGNTYMLDHKVPPHMTISAIEARSVETLAPAFCQLKGQLSRGKINIASIGQLLPYVMYGAPVMNEYLLDLSKSVYDAMKDIPDTTISKYYRPLSWMPHITLGKQLEKEEMQSAFRVLQEGFAPLEARVEEIGLARVNPHVDVERFKLI